MLGHSLGGALALVAIRLDPGFATRLVLEDPALAVFDPDQALHQLSQPFGVEVTPEWVAHHNPTWHPEDVRIKVESLSETSQQVSEAIVRQNEYWNVLAELAALTIPTLVLGADPELGALVPPALGEGLPGLNENVRFVSVPGASHSMHRDEFAAFMGEIYRFLG